MTKARIPILMAVCGKKGVGKSWKTMEYLRKYVSENPRRKVLIFDVNNEYSDIRNISLENVKLYGSSKLVQIRRVQPFFDDGTPMKLSDMARVLEFLIQNFFNGLLLIEDLNRYVGDNMPSDIIGALCTNRHKGVDMIIHFQSIGRITPKFWQNINHLRIHQNTDSVDRHRNKFEDKFEYLKIAEILIDKQYRSGNERYFLFVDCDMEKIHCGLSEEQIKEGITSYISQFYHQVMNAFINQRDGNGMKLYNEQTAFQAVKEKLYSDYFTTKQVA